LETLFLYAFNYIIPIASLHLTYISPGNEFNTFRQLNTPALRSGTSAFFDETYNATRLSKENKINLWHQ